MSSGDNLATPSPPSVPSPACCSHCGSLFIHTKGCRYCFSSKSNTNKNYKNRSHSGAGGKHWQCIVPCCTNSTKKTPNKKFFFPIIVGNERKQMWMKAVGVERLKTKVAICEEHFELEADLENYIRFKYYPTKLNRLKKSAIPTKFSCKSGITVPCPEHNHIVDLRRKKGANKRRRSDMSESGIAKKRRKVMASGAVLTAKFGHPPELRSPGLARVEVVQDGPDNEISHSDKFDFLNGDISTLIAHVQPSICSWDVSVVDVHSPSECSSASSVRCLKESSGLCVNGSRENAGGSKTEMKCATPVREQHIRTRAELTTGGELVKQTSSSSGSSEEIVVPDGHHPELQISNVEQPSKLPEAACEISMAVVEQNSSASFDRERQPLGKVEMPSKQPVFSTSEVQTNEASVRAAVDEQQNVSNFCDCKFKTEVENCDLESSKLSISVQDRPELSENTDQIDKNIKADSKLGGIQETNSTSTSDLGKCSDDTTLLHVEPFSDPASVVFKADLKSVNIAWGLIRDGSETMLDCAQSVSEVSPEETPKEIGDDSLTAEKVPSKEMTDSNAIHSEASAAEVTPDPTTTGDMISVSQKASSVETSEMADISEDRSTSEKASYKTVQSEPSLTGDTSPTSDEALDGEGPELVCSTSRMEIDPASGGSRIETGLGPASGGPRIEAGSDPASGGSRIEAGSDPASGGSRIEAGSDLVKSEEKVLLDTSFISRSTPQSSSLKKGRVSKENCSCVMCGGISDVEDSDIGDALAVSKNSPRTTVTLEKTLHEPEATPATASSSTKRPSSNKKPVPAQSSSLTIERILKNIDDQSDFSEYLTDENPDTTDIDFDSDSEWTPSESEATPVPTRTTRSSVQAKNMVLTRKTRNSGKASAESSLPKNVETDCDDEGESMLGNKSSLRVNLRETVAMHRLENSETTYSYKQLYECGDSNGETAEPKRSDKVLVVRDHSFEDFDEKEPLPQPMVDLLENMKMCFDHFFEKLENLKKNYSNPDDTAELDSIEADVKQPIKTLEEDVKMFPALLNLEMVEFVQTCKNYYKKKVEDLGESFKKIRWCANCPEAALFHCCFKAAYCSSKCQKKHWGVHRTDCAQECVTLLDRHMRLNKSLLLRVNNLNKSEFTISDLETLFREKERNQEGLPENASKNNENNSKPTPSAPRKRKRVASSLKTSLKTYPAKQRQSSSSTLKLNELSDPLKRSPNQSDVDSVEFTADPVETVSNTLTNKEIIIKRSVQKGVANTAASAVSNVQQKKDDSSSTAFKAPSAVKLTVSPQYRLAVSGKTVQLGSRSTPVGALASRAPSRNFLLPKPVMNAGGTNQVVVKVKSVTLPNGEKRLIPFGFPEEQNLSSLNTTSPTSGKPVTSGSSTILISRPPKSAYSPLMGFVPLSRISSPISHSMVIQQGTNSILTASPRVSVAPQLTPVVPPLPTLTPIPRQGSCCVRTLNDDELNKILNTDHLQSAFDDSYYANTRIRS